MMNHYHKRHIWYQIIISLISSPIVAFTIFALFFMSDETVELEPIYFLYLLILYVVIQLISIVYILLKWKFTTYGLTDDAIILKKGIIFKFKRTVPYSKIHAIDYKQNIIEKLFRIKKLSIDSGSTMNAEIAEILIIESNNKVEQLIKEIQLKKDPNSIEEEIKAEDKYLYKFSIKYKFLNALFKAALPIVLTIVALIAIYTLSYFFDDEHTASRFIEIVIVFLIFIVIIYVGILVYLIFRYYDYKVKLEDKYLIISYGIIKKIHNTLPLNRIKAIKVEEGLIRRLFKICSIKLELVGFGSMSENMVLNYYIPFCTKDKISNYIDQLQLDFRYYERLYNAPRKSWKYFYSLPIMIFSIIYLAFIPIVFIVEVLFVYIGLYLFLVLLILFASFLAYSNSGIYIDDIEVIVYGGAFNKKTAIILNENITCIEKVDTHLRSKKDIASYHIHFYNNAVKNVERALLLDTIIYDELIKCLIY